MFRAAAAAVTFATLVLPAKGCEVAHIMFGDIALDIIPHDGYETAIVRNHRTDSSSQNFGAIRGELTVDRGGFSIRSNNQVVVGFITPDMVLSGNDDDCDNSKNITIAKVKRNVWVILADTVPVGTIAGRFPQNDFGVK